MVTSYSPVAWIFREVIEEEIEKKTGGKIFFFGGTGLIDECIGTVVKLEEVPGQGLFIRLDSGTEVRIDRIITLFGKPGAAFEEYESYANACLDCKGGYEEV
jgi:hypothetical protein